MNPDHIAQCAQLAILLELSSGPKPGNVDRCHDFGDIGFSHFVASAVSAYPTFRKAASGDGRLGELLWEAAMAWNEWRLPGNTHFGSLVLMMPLAVAAGKPGSFRNNVTSVLEESTTDDAIYFYRAFDMIKARVADVMEYDLKDPEALEKLKRDSKTLLDLMHLSKDHDLIAGEWSAGYERCFQLAELIARNVSIFGLNEGVVRTYLQALADVPDSLVRTKFGIRKAQEISLRAKIALEDRSLIKAEELDRELLNEDANPGATADIIAASLFIAFLNGLRF
ncbi:MAG: triphosphoribosyl-dephospho-CoA synthase [Methanotrichaceae archaeon]|nr:triphosphoribosyl-dephospho-CoA synthase [Methanotrichaceae archaeon]